jgi:hypothetical protein
VILGEINEEKGLTLLIKKCVTLTDRHMDATVHDLAI